MYVCMYVCMYKCMHSGICVCMRYVRTYVCMYVCIFYVCIDMHLIDSGDLKTKVRVSFIVMETIWGQETKHYLHCGDSINTFNQSQVPTNHQAILLMYVRMYVCMYVCIYVCMYV